MFETNQDHEDRTLTRRRAFLGAMLGVFGGVAASALWRRNALRTVEAAAPDKPPKQVTIVQFSDAGKKLQKVKITQVVKTDAEWRAQLSGNAYNITRRADTEIAYTGKYWNNHDKGIYRCICCDNALFNSETKFESGTGWPSFWAPIASENVTEHSDSSLGMERTEVLCTECNAHLGHVFNDGPQPTGLRYCMNSASLRFVKAGMRGHTIAAMNSAPPLFREPTAIEKIFNRSFGFLIGIGLGAPCRRLLQVRGRKSGKIFSTPVNILDWNGKQYLVAPRGRTQWVRNAEASGEVTLKKGSSKPVYRLLPVTDAAKPPLLKAYLEAYKPEVQRYFRVAAGSPPEAFAELTESYPVFELIPR